jgi:GGDEF domain-containing protein
MIFLPRLIDGNASKHRRPYYAHITSGRFLLLMPNISAKQADVMAERIRSVAKEMVPQNGSVTFMVKNAIFDSQAAPPADADQAMIDAFRILEVSN